MYSVKDSGWEATEGIAGSAKINEKRTISNPGRHFITPGDPFFSTLSPLRFPFPVHSFEPFVGSILTPGERIQSCGIE
jgi:hypothetical protein